MGTATGEGADSALGVPALLPALPEGPHVWPRRPDPDWLTAPIGLVDEPRHQSQGPFLLETGRNVIVYGGSGSGKSTLLRTIATSLALTHAPRDLQVFAVDFGARALRPLRHLPHCGPDGVFFATETDRVRRLFRYLLGEVARRREAGIVNLRQQRTTGSAAAAAGAFPFLLVFLDNYAGFRETFEAEEQSRSNEHMVEDLATLMRDGPAVGLAFVLGATQVGGIVSGVENAAEVRLVLRQKDPSDYALVGRFDQPPTRVPPGRGFAAGTVPLELQIALPPAEDGDGADDSGGEWERFCRRLTLAAGGHRPATVQDLPRWVALDDPRLQPARDGTPATLRAAGATRLPVCLGLDDATFGPLTLELAEAHHLVVAGPPRSGKTTLLLSVLLSSLEAPAGRAARWFLVTPRESPWLRWPTSRTPSVSCATWPR